ncbi:MAG: CRISPR-associated helicase Cas3' [Anaerolineaceae bacterium]|nr:CRISPR-associated helicase Cas3' [Anaerolineaceae bacterium]
MNDAPLYQLLWAKTSKDKAGTHPLICHMIDVAQVTAALWDHAFPEATRRYFAGELSMDPASTRQWLAFLAGSHDLGKACPAFQNQHEPSEQLLSRQGLAFEQSRVPAWVPHGLVSAYALRRLLPAQFGISAPVARQMAYAVAGHHGVFPSGYQLQNLALSARGGAAWDTVRAELLQRLAGVLETSHLPRWPDELANRPAFWVQFAGLVSFADWLGSIESLFFDLRADELPAYADLAYQQAAKALAALGWTGWSPPTQSASFQGLFDRTPRPMQKAVAGLAAGLAPPALVIIEAPTGEGKTEAALYLADHWLSTAQQRGTYVAMPTTATSNQMLGRVREFLGRRYAGGRVDLYLLHGNAAWSEDMESLRLAGIEDNPFATVVAHSWFLPRKRSLLAPFAVGTVDQALLGVLQAKHFFVRLFGLSHKTVIFDEIHAYDTYMATLFHRLLRWLAAMDTTVVLLSATLPDTARRELMQAYTGRPFTHPVRYPAISWATADGDGVVPIEASPLCARTVALAWIDGAPAALTEALRAKLAGGGCVAVICNTVGRAQEVYRTLAEAQLVPDDDLYLFHARFPAGQRQAIEDAVLAKFGADLSRRPQRAIVVATQVIEQSLDLDFDLMVSDLAPVDLVLQRAGRLHRHQRSNRPTALAEPCLWLTCPQLRDDLPRWGSDAYVYEPYILARSYLALRNHTRITVPDDVQALIALVYDEADMADGLLVVDPAMQQPLDRDRAKMLERRDKQQYIARRNLIPSPEDEDVLGAANRQLDEDNPELHEAWRALTRLAPPSVTLVCLHEQNGRVTLDEEGLVPIDLAQLPDQQMTKALARRSVGVSNYRVVQHLLAQEPPEGWREHPMLRYHRAAIFRQGRCEAGGQSLVLDPKLGLLVEREEG